MNSKVLLLAVALDAAFGEPPSAVHPVVWMGRALALLERFAPGSEPRRRGRGAGPLAGAAAFPGARHEDLGAGCASDLGGRCNDGLGTRCDGNVGGRRSKGDLDGQCSGAVGTRCQPQVRARRDSAAQFAYGAVVAIGLPLAWAAAARALETSLPWPLQALVLKPTFAGRALLGAGTEVERHLASDNLPGARAALRALVSRPTDDLDSALVTAAAIESLAENFVDSWVAPLAAYALFGMAGSYAYRAANTADAMWGYHSDRFEYLGKSAARLDDVLNLLPSRLASLLLMAIGAGALGRARPSGGPLRVGVASAEGRRSAERLRRAFKVWHRDASVTASPNAGQTMAAIAGLLDVRLQKRDHYILNAGARTPGPADLGDARRVVAGAMVVPAALGLGLHMLARARPARTTRVDNGAWHGGRSVERST